MTRLATFLATGAYLGGRLRFPGTTVGSAIALLLYWFLAPPSFAGEGGALALLTLVAFCFLGVWASQVAEGIYGHDASAIVIDEMAGMWVSLIFLPKAIWPALAAFFIFRFFDIVKPFPAGRSQRLPGGWGVMTDDVVAGVYANLVVRAMLHFL